MDYEDKVTLPVHLGNGEMAFLKLPARVLTDREAKRLAAIIYSWGKDPDLRLLTVRRDDKGRFANVAKV